MAHPVVGVKHEQVTIRQRVRNRTTANLTADRAEIPAPAWHHRMMVLPQWLAKMNRRVANPLLRRLVGIGWLAELEHVGRTSGRTFRTVLMVFPRGDVVTVALTYGPDVDWLKNLRAAGGGRLRRRELLQLGTPRTLTTAEGLSRMPWPVRQFLPLTGTNDFVEIPVLARRPRRR